MTDRTTYHRPAKRAFDFAVAAALALPAAAVVGLAAIAIRWDSDGPALFRQTRVGRDNKAFTLYKLRTMAITTEHRASHEVSPVHITRIGRLLRSTKLDELPQLLNVLRGDMSLVGPRPCLPVQHELIDARERRGVHRLRPGITGPAQIAGIDMSTPERLAEADAAYLGVQTPATDARILIRTFVGAGRGDAVK